MDQTKTYLVATFGIGDFEREMLDRIFRLSSSRRLSYALVDEGDERRADIALLGSTTQEALSEWQAVHSERPSIKTVKVVNAKPRDSNPSIRRPLLARGVLQALDALFPDTAERQKQTPNEGTAARAEKAAQGRRWAKQGGGSYRALVVDDSLMIRTQVGLALQNAGIDVEYADSGEKALALVSNESFDIIFLDVVMTGLDGYGVCKAIKADRTRRHMPVVMLSSQSTPFDKIKGKFSGCNCYLTKPVRVEEFQSTLEEYLT